MTNRDALAYNFERLEHQTYSGEAHTIPLLVKEYEVVDEHTTGLLRIANIIGRENVNVEQNVLTLISETARVQKGLYEKPVMIADVDGGGAFTIDVDNTGVSVPGAERIELPTELLATFLNEWADYCAEARVVAPGMQ